MSLDHLLIWMSARGTGSWQQFRAAVEEFRLEADGDSTEDADGTFREGMPVYHQIRAALQALGHVEFSSLHDERTWRVVPPTLAVTRRNDQWIGLACGARSPLLYERDQHQNPALSWETTVASGMPSRIRVLSPVSHRLSEEATALGFLVQNSGPDALLAAIPPVDDPRCRQAANPPAGPDWLIERFSASDLRWGQVDRSDFNGTHDGLFRLKFRYQRFYFLRRKGKMFRVPVQVGKYAILRWARRRGILHYDANQNVLSVVLTCRPPLLIERALVLCSGLLPRLDSSSRRIQYAEVPWQTARAAAALLQQEVHRQ